MSKDDDSIKVLIDGVQRGTEALGDWNATVYEIDGLARGEAERVKLDAIEPDAVLELELANGNHILVAAADAGRYLGEPVDQPGRLPDLVVQPAVDLRRRLAAHRADRRGFLRIPNRPARCEGNESDPGFREAARHGSGSVGAGGSGRLGHGSTTPAASPAGQG